jgi:imidazolonepropionase-like amidohydrolase
MVIYESSTISSVGSEVVALVGGTVYPSPESEPLRDTAVVLRGGRIEAIGGAAPVDSQRIDCTGLSICAGFHNSHVHFFERKWAKAAEIPAAELGRQLEDMLTKYGFTTVFDTGSQWENTRTIRDRIESGEVNGPAIRSTGEGLIAPGGAPSDTVLAMMGVSPIALTELTDEDQAAAAARRLLDAGVDGVKLFVSSPRVAPIPEPVMAAAIREAHRDGKPAFAHPNNAADVLTAVRAGVDIVAHTTPSSGAWEPSLIDEMRARNVAITPTLTLWQWYLRHDRASAQQRMVETAVGQLSAWVRAGGEVLFGTDLGAVEYDPTPEYVLMSQAGMSFRQILESLTTAPARRFGGDARIAPGLPADLVVFAGDPAEDIRALGRVRYTIRGGRVVFNRP